MINEFTKQELEQLHESLAYNCENFEEPDYNYLLRDKIKSMIDNYHFCNFDMQGYCNKCNGWRGQYGRYENE